ncbi:hypothetical protein [Reichenbachiella ulvae]|uniref:SMI1/KNR4 family protein n=1 Tax=Reichenbachiella ulvae TaxID=2980104 RepID=A0ABT3CPH8_9BACT|nr:hypothetical protein [Reichenbachiella ulvae]MCV9385557.1 hypothetical protein [Reichenbachiella ulvae]
MKVLNKLMDLKKGYPDLVELYQGASDQAIKARLSHSKFPMKDELTTILKFSNGFSVLDYCFLGVLNPKIRGLETLFLDDVIIIGTSGHEEYGIMDTTKGEGRVLVNRENIYGEKETIVIANSLESFLEQFFHKCELLLAHHKVSDIVSYIDDERFEDIIPDWKAI